MPCIRRLVLVLLLLPALLPVAPASAQDERTKLRSVLMREMRNAAPTSGAYVANADTGDVLFGWKSGSARILASNTKIFTNAAALEMHGSGATFETSVLGTGTLDPATGVYTGDLYLRGGGDPSFGTTAYNRSQYGGGASIETLAHELRKLGVTRVRGGIVGDESIWDRLRGTAYSGFHGSAAIGGPLTALAFNHGKTSAGRFQQDPAAYAADRFAQALRDEDVRIDKASAVGEAPSTALELASVESVPVARLAQITGIRSENWFAEMLLKGLTTEGTTKAGAAAARGYARQLGSRASIVDGSGLSASNKAAPREIVDLLLAEYADQPDFNAFFDSLPTAGVNGTLATRMRSGPARARCRAKTGTLSAGHTALSGYCRTLGGDTLAFSIVMNYASISGARGQQDRMVQAIARYRG